MIDDLNKTIDEYRSKWQSLVEGRKDKSRFDSAIAQAAGWKAADLADFDKCFAELRGNCEQMHVGWLNDRWIAMMVLRDTKLNWDIQVIKLMQRRPNSTDAVGLDHIDFYAPDFGDADIEQAKESDLKITDEANGFCKWTSIWFDGTEAKMRRESVLDVAIAEMQDANKRILNLKV
ncbi:MAG TPA: hypothetical protein VLG47_03440 [Candidatus Saccharimonadales bacterium]|nr:hypothetical protein [Candidatus Saccharimonadales bacterium]